MKGISVVMLSQTLGITWGCVVENTRSNVVVRDVLPAMCSYLGTGADLRQSAIDQVIGERLEVPGLVLLTLVGLKVFLIRDWAGRHIGLGLLPALLFFGGRKAASLTDFLGGGEAIENILHREMAKGGQARCLHHLGAILL